MSRLVLISVLALTLASPVLASTGPMFLPEFTFPEPVTTPDVSTQGTSSK